MFFIQCADDKRRLAGSHFANARSGWTCINSSYRQGEDYCNGGSGSAANMVAFPVSSVRSASGSCHLDRDKRGLSRCGSRGHSRDARFQKMRCRMRAAYMVK